MGEPAEGREKQIIIDRILAASGADKRPAPKGKKGTQASSDALFALTPPAPVQPSLPWVSSVLRVVADPDPDQYRIAARVTDVFGNDGIATVNVEVK